MAARIGSDKQTDRQTYRQTNTHTRLFHNTRKSSEVRCIALTKPYDRFGKGGGRTACSLEDEKEICTGGHIFPSLLPPSPVFTELRRGEERGAQPPPQTARRSKQAQKACSGE